MCSKWLSSVRNKTVADRVCIILCVIILTPIISLLGGPLYYVLKPEGNGYRFLIPFNGVNDFWGCFLLGLMTLLALWLVLGLLFYGVFVYIVNPCMEKKGVKQDVLTDDMEKFNLLPIVINRKDDPPESY